MAHDDCTMDFDSDPAPQEVKVTYQQKTYYLREPSEAIAVEYQNMATRATTITDGEMKLGNLNDAEPYLVSKCLWEKINEQDKEIERNVPLGLLRLWPSRVVRPLFDKAKEMGRLGQNESEDGLKKEITRLQKKLKKMQDAKQKATECGDGDTEAHLEGSPKN
jgi:polyhydroxyalkanoate synthesis regulator phasin